MQAYIAKYRLNQPQKSRNERNRKINELLDGSRIANQYHDDTLSTSSLSPNEPTTDVKSFGDMMKQTLGDFFSSMKCNNQTGRPISLHHQSPVEPSSRPKSTGRNSGRIIGRSSMENDERSRNESSNSTANDNSSFMRFDSTPSTKTQPHSIFDNI